MNIFGIGTDIVNIKRIQNSLKKNKNFKKRIFTKFETKICENRANKINCFAKRFAAKEATWKALSSTRGDGIFFKEIEILNDTNGKPYLFFTGNTKKYIEHKENKLSSRLKFDISLSDEAPFVITFVVISLAPYV